MIELIVGLFIGTFCGVTVMVLCNIAADSDREKLGKAGLKNESKRVV